MKGPGVWIEFAAALLLIAWGGGRLARYGDIIAAKTGLGTTWIGLILLATVTSLPELITGLSAVALADSPDIAVGAILGSCVFNLLILVILDYQLDRESVYTRVNRGHVVSGGFGLVMIGVVGYCVMAPEGVTGSAIGHIGFYTPLLLVLYGLAVRAVFRYEQHDADESHADAVPETVGVSLARASAHFAGAAAVVVGAGIWLPFVGDRLADVLGIHETFVGTLFIAFATSVPEIAVAVAAVRLGAPNMAVSNLLGSNLFNILILAPEDVAWSEGPLLSFVSPLHAISALSAVLMTGITMGALLVRPGRSRLPRLGGVSQALLAIYLLNSYFLYYLLRE